MQRLVVQLAGLADVYVNDAFGSWQSHASTYHIAKFLPSYAGLCMQVCMLVGTYIVICDLCKFQVKSRYFDTATK